MERDDLYTVIHKVLRKGLFDLCTRAGATDFADPHAVVALREAWDQFETALRAHSRHERDFIHPALTALVPDGSATFDAEHDEIHDLLDGLAVQFVGLAAEANTSIRQLRGLELYRALNRLAATALPHFDVEEVQLMPRLWALFSDERIADIRASIMATIDADEAAYTVALANEALSPKELAVIRAIGDSLVLAKTA